MPELPEVETVRTGLSPVMEGVVIDSADVNRPDLRWPFPERMAERLKGQPFCVCVDGQCIFSRTSAAKKAF